MSVHLFAVKLVVTTDAPFAMMLQHDGSIVPNTSCPAGTVLAYDADDNLYVYVLGIDYLVPGSPDPETSSAEWPRVKNGTIRLYRDNWRHVSAGPDTPYGASFRNAKYRVLREA